MVLFIEMIEQENGPIGEPVTSELVFESQMP